MKLKTMTVKELREELADWPDNKLVGFAYPSGDHWRTELLGEIKKAEVQTVVYTEYHQCFKVTEDEGQEVLVLG